MFKPNLKAAVKFESLSNPIVMDIHLKDVTILGRGRIGYGNASYYALWKRSMIVYLSVGPNGRSTVCDIIGVTKSTASLAVSPDGLCLAVVDNASISVFVKDQHIASVITDSNQIELHSFTTQLSTGFELEHGILCFTENGHYRVVNVGSKRCPSNKIDEFAASIKTGIYNRVCDEFWELHCVEKDGKSAWFIRVSKGHTKHTNQIKSLLTVQHSAFAVGQDGVVSLLVQESAVDEQSAAKLTLFVFKPNGVVSATINNIEWPAGRLDLFPNHTATSNRCFIVSRHSGARSYSRLWACRDYANKSANDLADSESLHRFVVLFNGVPAIITHNKRDPLCQCGFAFIDLKLIDNTEQKLTRNRVKNLDKTRPTLTTALVEQGAARESNDPEESESAPGSNSAPGSKSAPESNSVSGLKSVSLAAELAAESGTAVSATDSVSMDKETTPTTLTDDAKVLEHVTVELETFASTTATVDGATEPLKTTDPQPTSSTPMEQLLAELDAVVISANNDESGTV